MDRETYNWHLEAGREAGIERTCGKKTKFADEEKAEKAATHHNSWQERKHDVEAYPCAFCGGWHIGRIMSR
jgi:hypothetical protein